MTTNISPRKVQVIQVMRFTLKFILRENLVAGHIAIVKNALRANVATTMEIIRLIGKYYG